MRSRPTLRLAADTGGIATAAALLRDGWLVAFGTETVYGLGADANSGDAIAALYAAKGRPSHNPLIVHLATTEAAFALVRPDPRATALAEAFWPGPLTLVLPRRTDVRIAPAAASGLDTLAVRVPGPAIARALIEASGCPIAAPSANRSGRVSPSTSADVIEELDGRIDAVLDSGPCPVGVESTVLDLSGATARLLRPGSITAGAIERVIGPIVSGAAPGPLRGPGGLASHYAPSLPVRLAADGARPDEALLAFGPVPEAAQGAALVWQLSECGDLAEAAARLYAGLRHLDREGTRLGLRGIAAMAVPPDGIGAAINDRLSRAATPATAARGAA